jgi:LAO/AO transport system kinase
MSSGSAASLLAAARQGDERALARLISRVEDGVPAAREVAEAVARARRQLPAEDGPHVIGLTGAPGSGKSTLVAALIGVWREAGRRVAVLAVDPSSPHSGGALLGDRVRMQRHAVDPGVYIRSLSSRGRLGGLSAAVPGVLSLLAVCRFDLVLVETLGVGQSEVDVARLADTVAVVLAPGSGDAVQLAKSGVIEIADVLVVSKSDLEGAESFAGELVASLAHGREAGRERQPPVVAVSAARGEGVVELAGELAACLELARSSGELEARRRVAAGTFIEAASHELLASRVAVRAGGDVLDEMADRMLSGELDPYAAAELVLAG